MKPGDFWLGFAAGAVPPLLKTGSRPEGFPSLGAGLEMLSAPGVVLSLPLHNLVERPWWALAVITVMNAFFYGAAVGLLARLWRRARRSGERKGG